MIKVIVFDFDGVIVDSNALKYNAFFKLFPESDTKAQNTVKEVMFSIGDRTRFKILEQIMKKLEKRKDEIENLVAHYAGKYNEIVQKEIFEKGLTPGALETLKNLSRDYNLYINSATPEFALKETLGRLDINRFLRASYGRISGADSKESAKKTNLQRIMEREEVGGEKVLVVGDDEADWQAAQVCGCNFIGISNRWNHWERKSFPLISSLRELPKVIKTL